MQEEKTQRYKPQTIQQVIRFFECRTCTHKIRYFHTVVLLLLLDPDWLTEHLTLENLKSAGFCSV